MNAALAAEMTATLAAQYRRHGAYAPFSDEVVSGIAAQALAEAEQALTDRYSGPHYGFSSEVAADFARQVLAHFHAHPRGDFAGFLAVTVGRLDPCYGCAWPAVPGTLLCEHCQHLSVADDI